MAAHGEKKRHQRQNPKHSAPKPDKPFKKSKREKKSQPAAPDDQLPASLLIQDEDPEFPRGGARVLSREEEAEARAEVDAEFERGDSGFGKGKAKRKKKNERNKLTNDADDELGSLFGEGVTGRLPKFANRVTLKNISPNMKLWGVIVEVNQKDLVVGLPGGLRGFVRIEDVSDIAFDDVNKDTESNSLLSTFQVGQLVSCIVLRVDDDKKEGSGNKRIWLSLHISLLYKGLTLDAVQDGMVLTAQVKSVEDHGYILHFGVPFFTGFLPRSGQGGSKFHHGQFMQCVVKNVDKVRSVVYLNADPDLLSKYVVNDLKGVSIDLLVPGMMVNARVHCTLENGIMLSFLSYFTGTADIFHLQDPFRTGSWKDEYTPNKKVNARILFIDPTTRAIGLTLNSHLIQNKVPSSYVKTGDIYDNSRILRVDRGIGLLLEIPTSPKRSPAYVSIFDVADEENLKLEKKFKEGSQVRVRVIGTRHLEGLAMCTLKGSAFEGSVFTHSEVKPGMLLKAKVIAVESFGAIVQISSGIKALCPLPHMSELDIIKPAKKFKVGAELLFRVLGCKSKRITVTHKKTLVKSKLNVLASYADAMEGLVTHGWITKIEKHGCFVKFYNGVQGFAHRSELALDPGSEADAVYHVGQVVKCRIISSVPASHSINLSFVISPKRVSEDDVARIGSVVCGVVERLTAAGVIVHVNSTGNMKGMLSNEHLADYKGQATLFRSSLRPGYKFDQLLVLDIEGQNLILSAKYSLIGSVQEIPSDIAQIHPLSVVHGYICNVIETGCFIRFLGRLTGFAPKYKATDEKVDHLLDAFYVGQSVRSYVLNVNSETDRIKLSLKQSLCFSTDVSFIRSYFVMEEKITALQTSDTKSSDLGWVKSFSIGTVVEGEVQERKEFGLVFNFKDHPDVVGFISNHHLDESNLEKGSVVRAFVLDIAASEGLVDLSMKPEFLNSAKLEGSNDVISKKKRRRATSSDLKLHQTVNAVVEIVKENYLVLSIPEHNYAIGYASLFDYNTQKLPARHFKPGQRIIVTCGELPSPASFGRLLLIVKCTSGISETSSSKRAKKASSYIVGSLVDAEVIDMRPLELFLKFGNGFHGRVHKTEVTDDDNSLENIFSEFRIGQLVNARIVAKAPLSGKKENGVEWELSLRPSVLAGSMHALSEEFDFSVGTIIKGFVSAVENEWVWLTVSRNIRAQLYILDSSCEPSELQDFQKRYIIGQPLEGRIISVHKDKRLLRVASCVSSLADHDNIGKDIKKSNGSDANGADHFMQGDIVGGRIKKILPGVGGMLVQIGPHRHGRVHYTELVDAWVSDPLSGFKEGQFVKCKVLELSRSSEGLLHVDLTLRESLLGIQPTALSSNMDSLFERLQNIDDLHQAMEVKGYVKNVTSKGCFIMLSRKIDARILLSNLSDWYIENPEKEFPVGSLVLGRVLSVDSSSKRVDVTLKKDIDSQTSKSEISSVLNVNVGDIVTGVIRRIESYGLFIKIDNTGMVGLCHISELTDEHIDNIDDKYRTGEKVVAKVMKVDEERRRISLGMKKSYIDDVSHVNNFSEDSKTDEAEYGLAAKRDPLQNVQQNDNSTFSQMIFDEEDDGHAIMSRAETRASVLPLQVLLDDSEGSDTDEDAVEKQKRDNIEENNVVAKKHDRRERKKAKEERELETMAAEERILQKDIPRTEEEFEKMVRSSPNSSFLWVQYMAFMESLADVEKARSIAERALITINFREETEKLNIWTAYFNLENQYGNPPEEAVKKVFHRALQWCDIKKVHLALLMMYERTEQHKLAEDLLERMTKKFKTSCKVWLHRVQSLLKQGKDGVQLVFNRALLSLPRRKHIKFISHTAILEFKCGLPDRGRSIFEGVLREYPKRTDLWSVYLDQEIRQGDPEVIRALFERVTSLSLRPRKIESLFKKYLRYEKSQGDDEKIEHVKRKAIEYAESLK